MAEVVPLRPGNRSVTDDVADWLAEYPNPRTRQRYGISLAAAITATDASSPADITVAGVATWLQSADKANNSVRGDITAIRAFLRWCHDTGRLDEYRDQPFRRLLSSYPATYGKVQAAHPAQRLTADQYRQLLCACHDDTDTGLRDELLYVSVSAAACGPHLFDLLEISEVLDHSNPKVTRDCYIGPLDHAAKDRAAALFG